MARTLYPRFALRAVNEALADTPVVVLQGARQVGKSTLAHQLAKERNATLLTLDDELTLRAAREDPVALVNSAPEGTLIIDEAQRAPQLILPLKANVDANRRPGRFLLTGSADLLRVKGVGDSLAGRAETVEMLPLSQGELARRTVPEDFITWLLSGKHFREFSPLNPEAVIRGGYPEAVQRSGRRAQAWFESVIVRLSDHDAPEFSQGSYAEHLRGLLALIAAQGPAELVKARIARDLGAAESSVAAYLRLARTMRLTVEIPAWSRAPRARVTRRPKVCLTDTGLGAALSSFTVPQAVSPGGREYLGALVEQLVTLELAKQQAWTSTFFRLHHYRDRDGLEVDLVAETYDGALVAIEVKSTQTITDRLWRNLFKFKERFPERNVTGVLLYSGDTAATLHGWLHVLPITSMWEH